MKLNRLVLLILVALPVVSSHAEVMKVEGARFRSVPIALPEPKAQIVTGLTTQIAQELIATVRNDLSWSAVFSVLDPKSYVADLSKEGVDRNTIRIESWTQIGAEALAKMSFSVNGVDIKVDLGIHPLLGSKPSGRKMVSGQTSQVKKLAHLISDEILTYFTGEPGMFNSKIVAARETATSKHIVVLDIDGSNERVLTRGEGPHILPTITPEGDAVLYTAFSNHNANLMSIGIDGSNIRTLSTKPDGNTGAQVSPNRKQIAFTNITGSGSQIYMADRDGKNPKKITDSFGINISPSFSPDGSKIAFVSSRSGNPQIYLMDASGQNAKRMTFQGKYNQTPRFSPKGDFIAFTGRDERNVFDLFLLEISSGKVSRITQDQGNNEDPWFSPNGRLIVFTSTRDGRRDLYVSNLDGTMQKRVTNGGGYYTPSWGPSK